MTVKQEKENPMFKRKDLILILKHEYSSTPSKAELVKSLAQERGIDESQVIIDYISTNKGVSESIVKVKILDEKPPVPSVITKSEEKKEEVPSA